ncbi:tetratricopeptide repeat protein [Azospirillum sp.]|uniref:tetratricopeptide repeat protein n=1 Tax=Azospirillum sp. TaxID=34012 RepID=UPI003D736E9A
MRIAAERQEAAASLVLSWPGAVKAEHAQDGRELTLRFSKPIGDARVDSIAERLSGWVDGVQYGYDSLLLVLAPDVAATVGMDRDGVRVAFAPAPRAAAPSAEDQTAERRLDYFRAVTMMEDGRVGAARTLLGTMLERDPADREAVDLLAQVAERQGRWREAVTLYGRALDLSPDNKPALDARKRLLREYGDQTRLDFDLFHVKNADVQRITRLTGNQDVGWNSTLRYTVERRTLDVDQTRRADGRLEAFHGQRLRGEMSLLHDWGNLDQSRLSLFAAPRTLGIGIGHDLRDTTGQTRLSLAVSEPTYAFVEGIVDAGRRDRLSVLREQRISERWGATLGGALNRYGLAGQNDLARSASVEGSLRYTFLMERPIASLAYVLDAEYVIRRAERFDPLGNLYVPLPVARREVHSLQVAVEDSYDSGFRYALQAGWSYDRFSKGGPFAAGMVGYEMLDGLETGLRASHTISTTRGTGSTVDAVGGYLLWRH